MTINLDEINQPTVGIAFRARRFARLLAGRDKAERQHAREFESDQRAGLLVRRPNSIQDHYDEPGDVDAFHKCKASLNGTGRAVVPARLNVTKSAVAKVLSADKSVTSLIDFGCHYGWLGNEIAQKFPNIRIISTDRFEEMQALNRAEFPASNLEFPAVPDIAAFVRENPSAFKDAVFTHTYTTMFLLPAAVRDLYQALHTAGTKYIVAHEQLGFSRHRLRQYQFSYQPQPSMWHRDAILLHNYPEIMRSAGFELIEAKAFPMPVPQRDWRSALFIAKSV